MTIRCELSDLPVDQCACRIHSTPAPTFRDFAITARFPARFDSKCDYCERPMNEGDPIARTDDGDYICGTCAP